MQTAAEIAQRALERSVSDYERRVLEEEASRLKRWEESVRETAMYRIRSKKLADINKKYSVATGALMTRVLAALVEFKEVTASDVYSLGGSSFYGVRQDIDALGIPVRVIREEHGRIVGIALATE